MTSYNKFEDEQEIKDEIKIKNKFKILKDNIEKMKLNNYTIEQIQKSKLDKLEEEEHNLYFEEKFKPLFLLSDRLQEEQKIEINETNKKKREEVDKLIYKVFNEKWKKEELKRIKDSLILNLNRLRISIFYNEPEIKNAFLKKLPIIERNVRILQNNSDISRSEFEERYSMFASLNNLISDKVANGDFSS
jgi:hypothetical protein